MLKTDYTLPRERVELLRTWWRVRDAAVAWECSYTTALRLIRDRCPEAQYIRIRTARSDGMHLCVPVGTPKPPKRSEGNPRMQDSEWQRQQVRKRWGYRRSPTPSTFASVC